MTEFIEFGGKRFYKQQNGYYKGQNTWLHKVVWEVAHGEIPAGYEIHHVDFNPSNNVLENLQCLPKVEHMKIHAAARPAHTHICENCGKVFEARNYTKNNRFCCKSCRIAWLRKQGYYDEQRICVFCGKSFTTRKDQKTKYCSGSCAKKAEPNQHRANGQFAKNAEDVAPRLTGEQKAWIRSVYKPHDQKYGATALGKIFGVHRLTISKVIHETD